MTIPKHLPVALVLLLTTSPALADQILMKDGQTRDVQEIRDAGHSEITYKQRGSVQRTDAADVARVIRNGDRYLDAALRLIEKGSDDSKKIYGYLKKSLDGGAAWAKPYAQFFIGEVFEQAGQNSKAVKAYAAVAKANPGHFYAPLGLQRAADILLRASRGAQAKPYFQKLASGDFGSSWEERGKFGLARQLLADGDHAKARPIFQRLGARASNDDLKGLAKCAEAHCMVLAGETRDAKRKFEEVLRGRSSSPAAKGYAWRGLGDCLKEKKPEDAVLAYLRSYLLYPSNPEANAAMAAAGEVAAANNIPGGQRMTALARSANRMADYTGDQPDAEVMKRCLQLVSASVVQKFAPILVRSASNDEKAELEFLTADAMKIQAKSTNDADLLAQYGALLKKLQKKYPNHSRAAMAGLDAFQAARDRALALIGQAKDEGDEAKKADLMAEGQSLFRSVLEPFKVTIKEMSKEVEELYEKEINEELDDAGMARKHEVEFQRDLSEFLLAESYTSYAQTFEEGSADRVAALREALQLYDTYITERGNFMRLLFYAYVGKADTALELGEYDEAIMQYEELTYIEAPFVPDDPKAKQELEALIQDICIRAYYGWTRALNKSGKGAEAYAASQQIDKNPKAQGWEDHPMGILLTFERSKALAGAGRGAQGAAELYQVIRKAKRVPESEKIPALGMSRIGAGACRALSELSDQTGGEIYAPEVQYYVGIGYFLRTRPELAVAAFKGVLTAARTRKEREEWVPQAVRQIGNLLFQQERYLEAALAYETVFSEFPDHDDAEDAVKFALSASKRAIEQFGEDINKNTPIVAFYRSIERKAVQSDASRAAMLFMNQAADLQKSRRYEEAANKYLQVPSEVDDDGKRVKVKFYANAIANAGYCYFLAYRKSKDESMLTKARQELARAADLARGLRDKDSQSLASFYLGALEVQLKQPEAALAALAPFDGELSTATGFLVRARFQQAQAHILQGDLNAAEADFEKVSDRTSDKDFPNFAYRLGKTFRDSARDGFKSNDLSLEQARSYRAKAAKYVSAWYGSTNQRVLRTATFYWWAGGILYDGGKYREAIRVLQQGMEKFPRPALDGGEEAADANSGFDLAEIQMASAQAMTGDLDAAWAKLSELRQMVYVTDMDDKPVMRGLYKDRELKGPFKFRREGRNVNEKRWFTVITVDGQDKLFYDTAQPRGGESQFQGVEGDKPSGSFSRKDERKIVRSLMRDFFVVEATANAAWGLWEQKHDKSFLADEVTSAINELRYIMRGMSEGYYAKIMSGCQLEPTDYDLAVWQADVLYLRLKLAREKWAEVSSDISQMEMLGTLGRAPAEIKAELLQIKKEAESR